MIHIVLPVITALLSVFTLGIWYQMGIEKENFKYAVWQTFKYIVLYLLLAIVVGSVMWFIIGLVNLLNP